MKLPHSIAGYFEAANAGDNLAAAACFSESAIVHDEDLEHRGHRAIRAWLDETTRKYQPRFEILSNKQSDGHVIVTSRVSGDFPNSPVKLEFDFTLEDKKFSVSRSDDSRHLFHTRSVSTRRCCRK